MNAQIISYNLYGETVCASAARISTTKGDALEIFQNASDREKNQNLIRKVLASGHVSVIEHMTFTIALRNISVLAEEFFIEHRLASYTVKSRRYVDYSEQGYYIPDNLPEHILKFYQDSMSALFDAYHELLSHHIPKEDARFLLPYAFHSNFYCTLNAREFIHALDAMRYGPPELREIANQLETQLHDLAPFLFHLPRRDISTNTAKHANHIPVNTPDYIPGDISQEKLNSNLNPVFLTEQDAGIISVIQAPVHPERILKFACQIARPESHPESDFIPDFGELVRSDRPRELEQISYTFAVQDITLSSITHMVRHRMQSPIIPPIQSIRPDRFILPASIQANPDAKKIYQSAAEKAFYHHIKSYQIPELKPYRAYFALSGNLANIMTTMNARELEVFIRLRTCRRAQWEIRAIAIRLLNSLRHDFPDLFQSYGPACYQTGVCPEGRLSCGKSPEVIKQFQAGQII